MLRALHEQDRRNSKCKMVTLVSDNLDTHTIGAFYQVFPPERARKYVEKINFVYTPKHGSWLNVAEFELSCCLSGQTNWRTRRTSGRNPSLP
ncbi:MAG: transposase [Planctomycetales bacterium]|nr:transposase [Planctomycetales bacterium]